MLKTYLRKSKIGSWDIWKFSYDAKDVLKKVSDDGDDIFEKVSDDAKDILVLGLRSLCLAVAEPRCLWLHSLGVSGCGAWV